MSRISQLKETIEINQARIVNCTQFIKEAKDELSALEARERKPREWKMYLSHTGDIYPEFRICPAGRIDKITVIEKLPVKPIVVTKQMASIFLDCLTSGNVNPTTVSNGLKAAFNIDAEPSND